MFSALELRNFAIVDTLRLDLSVGLNVLSGETGAGKSVLIDALTLLAGARAESTMIRSGEESALVQAELVSDDGPSSLSRRLKRQGRGSARVDGEIVRLTELKETAKVQIAIHGQHAYQTLMSAQEQRKLLDSQLTDNVFTRYQSYYRDHQARVTEHQALNQAARERAQRLDMLQYQVDEICRAQFQVGEEEELRQRRETLRHAERIQLSSAEALYALSEAEDNALALLQQAGRALEQAARYHPDLSALTEELNTALDGVQAIASEIEHALSQMEAEPGALEQAETRLALIDSLKLKYGDSIQGVLEYAAEASDELRNLANADDRIAELETQLEEGQHELEILAEELSQARAGVAAHLSEAVSAHLPALGMKHAQFVVEMTPLDKAGAQGRDHIAFLFSANLGEPPAPLSSVASGGELSRLMLALHLVSGADAPTLVFDEVDAGIGGSTARALGALLKQLAQKHQVLVVTHLPQVAAYADSHYYVEKIEEAGRTRTHIRKLSGSQREAELARMLSGTATTTAIAHAKELLREITPTSP